MENCVNIEKIPPITDLIQYDIGNWIEHIGRMSSDKTQK
jgi:hypothetical protein